MKINQRKAGVILSYGQTIINAIVGFIYIPLLIYFLGQDEFGLYQLLGSFLVYLSLFDFGLSNTVTRYYSKYKALKDKKGQENLLALSSIIYIFITIFLVIVGTIIYFYIDNLFINTLTSSEIELAKKMFIVILINVALQISTSVFNSIITSNERFLFLKGLAIIQIILRPILVFAIFTIEANALSVVIVQAIINIAGILIKIYYSFVKLQVKIKFHFCDKPLLKDMIYYSFFIFITLLMDQIFWRSGQVILGVVDGTGSVAIYSIATQIVMYYMALSTSMSGVFLPNITQKVINNVSDNELSNFFIKIGRLQYILLGVVLTGFILYGEEFITLWVGKNFSQSYYITLLILIPFTIDLIQNIGLTILQAKNMYSFRAAVLFVMSLLNIVVAIPLSIQYGGIGAAIATGIAYIIGNGIIMNIYYYKKVNLNIPIFWKEISKLSIPMLLTFTFGLIIKMINLESAFLSLFSKIVIYMIIYMVIIWRVGMNKYEKELFSIPFRKFLKLD